MCLFIVSQFVLDDLDGIAARRLKQGILNLNSLIGISSWTYFIFVIASYFVWRYIGHSH